MACCSNSRTTRSVFRIHYDRPIQTHNYLTSVTVGARTIQELLGDTGPGVGVAVIDSGIGARKVGAVQEGLLRKSFLKNGEYLDQALWTILDDDWIAGRAWQAHTTILH